MTEEMNKKCRIFAGLLAITLAFAMSAFSQDTALAVKTDNDGSGTPAKNAEKNPEKIKVTFDETHPGFIIIESNGEKLRVDTVTKKVERIGEPETVASNIQTTDKPKAAQDKDKEEDDPFTFESGDEPFDYRLVNVPTPKKVPKGSWNINFTHRFSQPINPLSESAKALLGFDSVSSSAFGVMYGITDKLYINAARSPLCQRGMCRVVEVGLGYHVTDQNKNSPVAFNVYSSIEGSENFTRNYTYNFQAMVSRNIANRVFFFFAPAFHVNSNGQRRFDPKPDDYFPPSAAANAFRQPANTASFGMGTQVRITPGVSAMFEFTPRTGFKLGRVDPIFDNNFNVIGFNTVSYPEMGIGVMYVKGKHAFTLTLSNTQTTLTSRYNSSNLVLKPHELVIGFNLFRRW